MLLKWFSPILETSCWCWRKSQKAWKCSSSDWPSLKKHSKKSRTNEKRAAMIDTLKIMKGNANGLLQRKLELAHFLNSNAVDIALISEAHCTQHLPISKSGNYKVYNTKDRGCITIFVRSRLNHERGNCISTPKMQLTSITVHLHGVQTKIAAVYRPSPPSQPSNQI